MLSLRDKSGSSPGPRIPSATQARERAQDSLTSYSTYFTQCLVNDH